MPPREEPSWGWRGGDPCLASRPERAVPCPAALCVAPPPACPHLVVHGGPTGPRPSSRRQLLAPQHPPHLGTPLAATVLPPGSALWFLCSLPGSSPGQQHTLGPLARLASQPQCRGRCDQVPSCVTFTRDRGVESSLWPDGAWALTCNKLRTQGSPARPLTAAHLGPPVAGWAQPRPAPPTVR